MRELVDLDRFEQWLANNRNAIVGVSGTCRSCPIAAYLRSHYINAVDITVTNMDAFIVTADENNYIIELPEWASSFIALVDGDSLGYVYGKRALELLQYTKENA